MSEVYIKEPATKGACVLHTTHGDLEIELWATECPKACRNFCQLILEGYYNDTMFHRVIKDFIIQGGDKTGTGDGSESIYDGKPYPDEIHPRLKFRYRGMMGVASAGAGSKTNGSQFFIVMNRAPTLDRKHTLFGKVVGQTIYNLVRLTEVEVDKNDTPIDPPRIIRAELTWDPFGDLEPRFTPAPPRAISSGNEKHRREAIKNKKILSFGGDEDSEDDEAPAFGKARSAHDVLSDPKLLKEAAYASSSAPSSSRKEGRLKEEASRKRPAPKADEAVEPPSSKSAAASAPPTKAVRRKAAASESESGSEKEADFEKAKENASSEDESDSDEGGGPVDPSEKRNAQIQKLKRDIGTIRKGDEPAPVRTKPKSAWEELLAGFKTRKVKNAEKDRGKKGRQAEAVEVVKGIKSFQERVRDVPDEKTKDEELAPEVKAIKEQAQDDSLAAFWEEGLEESTEDWLTGGGLDFAVGQDKVFKKVSGKQKETLEIFDPLAAAGDAEMMEMARKRRSAQLKPSLRRSAVDVAASMASGVEAVSGQKWL